MEGDAGTLLDLRPSDTSERREKRQERKNVAFDATVSDGAGAKRTCGIG